MQQLSQILRMSKFQTSLTERFMFHRTPHSVSRRFREELRFLVFLQGESKAQQAPLKGFICVTN